MDAITYSTLETQQGPSKDNILKHYRINRVQILLFSLCIISLLQVILFAVLLSYLADMGKSLNQTKSDLSNIFSSFGNNATIFTQFIYKSIYTSAKYLEPCVNTICSKD